MKQAAFWGGGDDPNLNRNYTKIDNNLDGQQIKIILLLNIKLPKSEL